MCENCVCVCVCVCERERQRETERDRERETVCVCVRERDSVDLLYLHKLGLLFLIHLFSNKTRRQGTL